MESLTMWRIGEQAVVADELSAYYLHTVRVREVHDDIVLVEYELSNSQVVFAVHQDDLLESA